LDLFLGPLQYSFIQQYLARLSSLIIGYSKSISDRTRRRNINDILSNMQVFNRVQFKLSLTSQMDASLRNCVGLCELKQSSTKTDCFTPSRISNARVRNDEMRQFE